MALIMDSLGVWLLLFRKSLLRQLCEDVSGPWKNFCGECKLGLCQQRALELREGLEGRGFPFSCLRGAGGSSSYAFQVLCI